METGFNNAGRKNIFHSKRVLVESNFQGIERKIYMKSLAVLTAFGISEDEALHKSSELVSTLQQNPNHVQRLFSTFLVHKYELETSEK